MKLIKLYILGLFVVFITVIAVNASQIKTQQIKIGKHSVYYNTAGKGDKVILFLHGLFANKEQWAQLMKYFSDKGYYTVALDLPGFGKSQDYPLNVYTIDNQIILLNEFIEKTGLKNINLAGNSFGCAIAIAFTEKNKDKVNTLALLGGPAGLADWAPELLKEYENGSNPFIPLTEKEFKKEMELLFYDSPKIPEETIKKIVGKYKKNLNKYISIFNLFNLTIYNFTVNFNISFNKPTLIVWGKEDKIFSANGAKEAQKKIPGSKLEILDKAGHLLMIENAKETAEIYIKFLRNLKKARTIKQLI